MKIKRTQPLEVKNVFLVESPLQVLNSWIAIKALNLEGCVLIARKKMEKNDVRQIRRTLSLLSGSFNKIVLTSKTIDYYRKNHLNFEGSIYVGDVRSSWMHKVNGIGRAKRVTLIDDGAASLFYQENWNLIEGLMNKANCISVFTSYKKNTELPTVNYSFWCLNRLIENHAKHESGVVFVGSALSFKAESRVEEYLEMIVKVKEKYGSLTYIPHRAEHADFCRKLKKIDGINIVKPFMPFELWYCRQKKRPIAIYGWISSVFYSMPQIAPDIEYICLRDRHAEEEISKTFKPWGHNQKLSYKDISNIFYENLSELVKIQEI